MKSRQEKYVQFGCGLSAPKGWLNLDSSPLLRLQKLPMVGQLMPAGPFGRFPSNVFYGDIVRGLKLPNESVERLYCSHILEHLSLSDMRKALAECRRILNSDGTFRLVLPDLNYFISEYSLSQAPDASIKFMQETYLGKESRARGLTGFIREWLGNSNHLWMWDYKSMKHELEEAGFRKVRRAEYNDSEFAQFKTVEDAERWTNALGIECRK